MSQAQAVRSAEPLFSLSSAPVSTAPPIQNPPAAAAAATARTSVVQLAIREQVALYQAYIPLFAEGGIFVPTTRECRLGDDLYLLLTLPGDTQRWPVAGKVAWINPARAQGNRTQGVGVRFPKDEKSRALRHKIEELLAGSFDSDRATQTV